MVRRQTATRSGDRCVGRSPVTASYKAATWLKRPVVERTRTAFDDPVGVMRDLCGASSKGDEPCTQRGIPDLLCQMRQGAAPLCECGIRSWRPMAVIRTYADGRYV